jgi:hypothetical protein
MIVSHVILLGMRKFSDRICEEDKNTHFMYKNRALYDIMWKNMIQPCRSEMTI